ncbi:hypothetical protein ACFLY6_01910 [Candidatus Dependentiae bacterium]
MVCNKSCILIAILSLQQFGCCSKKSQFQPPVFLAPLFSKKDSVQEKVLELLRKNSQNLEKLLISLEKNHKKKPFFTKTKLLLLLLLLIPSVTMAGEIIKKIKELKDHIEHNRQGISKLAAEEHTNLSELESKLSEQQSQLQEDTSKKLEKLSRKNQNLTETTKQLTDKQNQQQKLFVAIDDKLKALHEKISQKKDSKSQKLESQQIGSSYSFSHLEYEEKEETKEDDEFECLEKIKSHTQDTDVDAASDKASSYT